MPYGAWSHVHVQDRTLQHYRQAECKKRFSTIRIIDQAQESYRNLVNLKRKVTLSRTAEREFKMVLKRAESTRGMSPAKTLVDTDSVLTN